MSGNIPELIAFHPAKLEIFAPTKDPNQNFAATRYEVAHLVNHRGDRRHLNAFVLCKKKKRNRSRTQ